jgi:hypothetical protein
MPTTIDPDKQKKRAEEVQQWPNKDFDWSGQGTVPENPKKSSGIIVSLGTAFAFAALGGLALAHEFRDVPQVAKILSVIEKPFAPK